MRSRPLSGGFMRDKKLPCLEVSLERALTRKSMGWTNGHLSLSKYKPGGFKTS